MTVQNLSIEELDSEDFDIVNFTAFNEEHWANACCELPTHIFIKAVEAARCIDWWKDSPYWNNWEAHPAMKLVCDWWNTTAPDLSVRCAGSFDFVARVDNGSQYISSDHGMYINSIILDGDYSVAAFSNCNARLGDILLFIFQKGKAGYIQDVSFPEKKEIYFDTYLVDGNLYSDTAGENIENADDSWVTLHGLKYFPENFPMAWEMTTFRSDALAGAGCD
jgi:hypothetical protein